jgi:hypothetical protein
MADNYLQFSETLDNLTADEESWLNEQLTPVVVIGGKEFVENDPAIEELQASDADPDFTGPRFLRDNPNFDSSFDVMGFEFAFEDRTESCILWLYSESYGNPENAAWLAQKVLKQFRPDQCWSLTYASTCSKPRVGEFGGGAVFVTANEIEWQSADDFAQRRRANFHQDRQSSERKTNHGKTTPTEP